MNEAIRSSLNWRRLSVALLNIRSTPATKAHPLSVFQAIIKGVTTSVIPFGNTNLFFHIKDRKHTFQIRTGDRINIELFFCGPDAAHARTWRAAFTDYLSDPVTGKNFDILDLGPIEERNYTTLVSETGPIPEEGELCLEFLTPIPFTPAKNRHRTFLPLERFIRLFEKRFQKLFDEEIPYNPQDDDFKLLPYYWNYTELRHPSKSQPGHIQYINGCTGKLYMKGRWPNLLPFLILGAELHAGTDLSFGRGYYKIHARSPGFFSAFFPNKKALVAVIREVAERYDNALIESLRDQASFPFEEEKLASELCSLIAAGTYIPSPNIAFTIKKKQGTERLVEQLTFRDIVVQQYLLRTLTDLLDRMFEESSIGFRKGLSRKNAIAMIQEAFQEGYVFIIESDIEDFFASVEIPLLMKMLEEILPAQDGLLKELIEKAVSAGYLLNGVLHERTRGLAQGSPLSPILANLYLDSFDEEVKGWNVKMIRYADDFVILARTREEAEAILLRTESFLSFLGLKIKKEKTAIRSVRDGFVFLGMTFDKEGCGMQNDECGMMNERCDLLERTKVFALRIIRLYVALPKTTEAQVIGKQLLRSGTSVGAHVREGKRSRSDAEMISKTEGALKELEETTYWLELLADSGIMTSEGLAGIMKETNELTAILVTSTRTLKDRKTK